MKIGVHSDLHSECSLCTISNLAELDVLVLAGDIGDSTTALLLSGIHVAIAAAVLGIVWGGALSCSAGEWEASAGAKGIMPLSGLASGVAAAETSVQARLQLQARNPVARDTTATSAMRMALTCAYSMVLGKGSSTTTPSRAIHGARPCAVLILAPRRLRTAYVVTAAHSGVATTSSAVADWYDIQVRGVMTQAASGV